MSVSRYHFIDGTLPAGYGDKPKKLKGDRSWRWDQGNRAHPSTKNVDHTQAWKTYQEQLAAGLGEPEDYAGQVDPDWGPQTTGNRVKELRRAQMLTQGQLGRRVGVGERTVAAVEKGLEVRRGVKKKLVKGLRVPWERRFDVFPI